MRRKLPSLNELLSRLYMSGGEGIRHAEAIARTAQEIKHLPEINRDGRAWYA